MTVQLFQNRYDALVRQYASDMDEVHLLEAADLGRELIQADVPIEDLAQLLEGAFSHVADRTGSTDDTAEFSLATVRTGRQDFIAPLTEMLMAYGLEFRERDEHRRQAEEALRDAKDDLEVRVRVRTAELEVTNAHLRREVVAHRRARKMLETRSQHQAAAAELGLRALTEGNLSHVLDAAVNLVARTLDVEFCKILELQSDAGEFLLVAGTGWDKTRVGVTRFGSGPESHAGFTLLADQPVILDDLRVENRFVGHELLHEKGIVSGIGVVIKGPQQAYGVLAAHSREFRSFTAEDANYLQIIANVLAAAIQRREEEQRARQQRAELAHIARLSMMGEMASQLAHELNQPLAAIGIYVESAIGQLTNNEQATKSEELITAMHKVVSQAHRAGEIIHRLREFIRRREPSHSSAALPEMVDNVCGFLELDVRYSGVQIERDIPETLPLVPCDSIQIEQVLLNLTRNGIDAMKEIDESQRKLIIRARSLDRMLEVQICDQGPDISDDAFSKLFEPFYTTKSQGFGLGLSISRTIIEAHGGSLCATRNSNRGLTFRFMLPASLNS